MSERSVLEKEEMEAVVFLERRKQKVKKQVIKTWHSISCGFML